MNALQLEFSQSLRAKIQQQAAQQKVSEAAFIEQAVQEKLDAIEQLRYLSERATRGNAIRFRELLARVPAINPVDEDRL